MKTPRHFYPYEHCHTSLSLLEEKLKERFGEKNLWIPDFPPSFYQKQVFTQKEKALDTILFGGSIRHLFQAPLWPKRSYKLWVTSYRLKQVLEELFFFPRGSLSLFDRYELFPSLNKNRQKLDLNSPWTLVISGRISPVKNIEGAILFAHALQKEHQLPVKLVLAGKFDNEKHDDRGRRAPLNYEKKIHKLIEELSWDYFPEFYADLSCEEWMSLPHPQKVLLSFSTYIGEDFNTSLAQSQQQGWPAIISNWGGHREVRGENIYKLPAYFLPQSHTPLSLQRGQADRLALLFLEKGEELKETSSVVEAVEEKFMSREEVQGSLERAIDYWGPKLLGLARDQIDYFADTFEGREFFERYRQIFSNDEATFNHLLLLPQDEGAFSPYKDELLYKIGYEQVENDERFNFFYKSDIRHKDILYCLQDAKKLSFSYEDSREKELIKHFKALGASTLEILS